MTTLVSDMSVPFTDLELYDLPVDNMPQYDLSIPQSLKLMVVTLDNTTVEELSQLSKILGAAKIDDSDVYHLTIKNKLSVALGRLIRVHQIENIVSFGVHPFNLGLKIPNHKYVPNWFEDALFIYSDNLSTMMKNQNAKKHLWNTMKNYLIPRFS